MGMRIPSTENFVEKRPAESILPKEGVTAQQMVADFKQPQVKVGTGINAIPDDELASMVGTAPSNPVQRDATVSPQLPPSGVNNISDDEFASIAQAATPNVDQHQDARILARNVDLKQIQNVKSVAEKLKVSPLEAGALIARSSVDELNAMPEIQDIQKNYPGVSTWAQNPDNYRLLQQDPQYAKKVEDTTSFLDSYPQVKKFAKDANDTLMQTLNEFNKQVAGAPALVYNLAVTPGNLVFGYNTKAPDWLQNNPMMKYYDEQGKALPVPEMDADFLNTVKTKVSKGDYAGLGRDVALKLIQFAPVQALAFMGSAAGAPMVALAGISALQASGTNKEMSDKNISAVPATLNSVYQGAVMAVAQKVGTFGVLEKWESVLAGQVGKAAASKLMPEVLKALLFSSASEGASFGWMSAFSDLSSYATGVNPKALEGIGTRAAGQVLLGAVTGATTTSAMGATSGLLRGREVLKEALKARRAVEDADTVAKAREDKAASPVAKEHPQQMEELVNKVGEEKNKNAPSEPRPEGATDENLDDHAQAVAREREGQQAPTTVKFNLRQFNEVAERKGILPEEMAKDLGPNALNDYTKARDNNHTDFSVDYSEYLRHSDEHAELDKVAYLNDNEYNKQEGEQKTKDLHKEEKDFILQQSVYHGSPHEVDKFSSEKIGTGEGVQAFGYGLYFSSLKRIADFYAKKLSRSGEGSLYKVDVPTEDSMLHWNQNVADQEPYVVNKLKNIREVVDAAKDSPVKISLKKALMDVQLRSAARKIDLGFDSVDHDIQAIHNEIMRTGSISEVVKQFDFKDTVLEKAVKDLYLSEGGDIGGLSGETIYKALSTKAGSDQKASKILDEAGIPGIKYAAEGGKSEAKNYVIFNDENINIQERLRQQGDESKPAPDFTANDVNYFNTPEGGKLEEGDTISRPIELLQIGRSPEEKSVFNKINKELKRSLKDSNVKPETIDQMSELQFQHTKFRAEQLGLPIKDVAEQLKAGSKKSLEGTNTIAYFRGGEAAGEPRSSVIFGPETKANDLVHEFAHSWLNNMANDWHYIDSLTERTPVQQEYHDAMTTTAKLLGLESVEHLKNAPEAQFRKVHETFAQTAEHYMLEQNFADSRLRKIFDGMKRWMAEVAQFVGKAYPMYGSLKISPEVHSVFQTILAGTAKVEENMREMFPKEMTDPKMMGAHAEEYAKAIADSRDQAVTEMYSKFFNRSEKERNDLIRKAQNELHDQAKAEIAERPSMQLMDFIKAGDDNAKITHQSIVEVLANGDEKLAEQIKSETAKGIIAGKKKVGVDIRDVMHAMDINDPKEMIAMLREMGKRDAMIDDRTNGLIDEKFPVLKSDEEIHKEAVDAINNSGKEKVLALELKYLAGEHLKTLQKMNADIALPPEMLSRAKKEVVREQGRAMVDQSPAFKLKPDDFRKAANRYGRNASDLLKKTEYEKAFWAKQQESVNHQAELVARKQLVLVNNTIAAIERMTSLSTDKIAANFDIDIYRYGQHAIHDLNSGKPIARLDPSNFVNNHILDPSKVNDINRMVDSLNENMRGIDPKKISTENFIQLGDMLKSVRFAASNTLKTEGALYKEFVSKSVGDLREEVGPRQKGDPIKPEKPSMLMKWNAGLINFRTLLVGLFPSEEAFAKSKLSEIPQKASNAQAELILGMNLDNAELDRLSSEVTKNNPEMQSLFAAMKKRVTDKFTSPAGTRVPAPEIGHTFKNIGEVLKLLMINGSESGRIKLGEGGLVDEFGRKTGPLGAWNPENGKFESPSLDAMIDRMLKDKTITKAHMDFVQGVHDIFARHYEGVRESSRYVRGTDLGKIQSRKLVTPWGEYEGGYVPLKKDAQFRDLLSGMGAFSVENPDTFFNDLFPSTNMSMTKSRGESSYPVNLDITTLHSDLNAVYRVKYMLPTMYDIGKILDHADFRNAMEARRPGAMKNIVEPWFDLTMAQTYAKQSDLPGWQAVDKVARGLRINMRVKAFLGNYKTWLKQYLDLFPAAIDIHPKYLAKAAAEVGFNPSAYVKEISELSPRMKVHMEDNSQRAIKSLQEFTLSTDKLDKVDDFVRNKAVYKPIQFFENHSAVIVFKAAMDQAINKFGLEDKQKIYDYATDAVMRSKGGFALSDRPSIMTGTETQKLLTDFMHFPLVMYGKHYETYRRNMDAPTFNRVSRQLYALILTSTMPAIAGHILSNMAMTAKVITGNAKKDDETGYFSDMAIGAVKEASDSLFPLSGRNAVSLFNPKEPVGNIPALRTAATVKRAGMGLNNAVNPFMRRNTDLKKQDIYNMLDAVTILTGQPTAVISRIFKDVEEIAKTLD